MLNKMSDVQMIAGNIVCCQLVVVVVVLLVVVVVVVVVVCVGCVALLVC